MSSGLDRMLSVPSPRQQFVQTVDRMSVDHSLQHVTQVCVRLDVIELARLDQQTEDCPSVPAAVATCKDGSCGRAPQVGSPARRGSCRVRCGRHGGSGSIHPSATARTGSLRRDCCGRAVAGGVPRAKGEGRQRSAWRVRAARPADAPEIDHAPALRRHRG